MKILLFVLVVITNLCYGQVNLNQGLVSHYPFTGNPNEVTGNGLNGITQNGAQLTTDRFGNPNSAYYFDGVDDYIQIPSNASLNPTTAFSITLYFNPEQSSVQTLIGKIAYFAGVGTQYQIAINFGPFPGVLYGTNPPANSCAGVPLNGAYVNTGGSLPNNQWYCVVATFDNGLMKIYLNGVLIQTTTASFNNLNICSNADVQIGSWWDGDKQRYKGKIDDVRFYNRAINQAEVTALCTQTTVPPSPVFTIINSYTPVTNLNVCQNKINVEDASSFNSGDTVLLIQMKGAVIDSSNTSSFGNLTNYKNAGNYEFNIVKSKTGNIVELKNSLLRQYDIPWGKVQLIRVPYYNDLTISNMLTCLPWDGSKGGVLAFNVKDSITMAADMDVSGKGFTGGNSPNTGTATLYCARNEYNYPKGTVDAAEKGESITTIGANILWGKGAPANAGGGGLGHNSGGGGGGNAGAGGLGGYQSFTCGNAPFDNRGIGAHTLTYNNGLNKIFMGGGGGSGHADNTGGSPMRGGNGGGIILINSPIIKANNYKIIANGANAPQCTSSSFSDCYDASGGGGGGGAIIIKNNNYANPIDMEVKGGKGGDVIIYNPAVGADKIGPGGGGGAGVIWLNNSSLPANVNTNVNGGVNGVISLDNKNPWGATAGSPGTVLFNLSLPISSALFTPNIDSVRIKDSATSCNSFAFKGLGFVRTSAITQWQWNFGDGATANTQNTTHTYSLPGSYALKLVVTDLNGCKDSITTSVSTSGITNDFGYTQDICNPLSFQFNNLGGTPASTYWNFGDGNTTINNLSPTHTYAGAGNYTVRYGFQNGSCADTVTKTISVNVVPDNIILTQDTTICFGTQKQLRSVSSLNFCWSPTTYLNDPLLANPVTSTPVPITYYLTAEVPGTNVITNGNFNAGNTGFTSDYTFAANNTTEGEYFVGSSPLAWNAALSNCSDHTTGSGNMLLVNGSPVANVNVWRQTVAVTPNTNYAFSSWIQALYPPNPAQLSFSINGSDIGTLITASLPTCTWSQFYTTWNSGSNTTATISIVNKNTIVQGNDFALDDISFAPVVIKRDSIKITIDTPIVKTITDTSVCRNTPVQLTSIGAVTYTWLPATGLSSAVTGNPFATPADTTQYIVTGTNANGCTAKDTVMVYVKPLPLISTSGDNTICVGQAAQLLAGGGSSYAWSPAASLNNAVIANPIARPTASTTYTVVVTGGNNCSSKDSLKISLKALPIFSVSNAYSTCANGTAPLNAAGGTSYLWSPAQFLNNASIPNPIATVSSNTLFTVLITDSICKLSASLSTNVTTDLLPPVITASKSNDMDCVFSSVQLKAVGADVYSWSPAANLSSSTIANPIAKPAITQQYTVVGTNSINNCKSRDTITVFVKSPTNPTSYIPNTFTPNADGSNDCFRVRDFGTVKTVDLMIFNRYGNLVFQTKNANDCWDGSYKGQPAEVGNYVYYVKVLNDCGEEIKKGNLLLLR